MWINSTKPGNLNRKKEKLKVNILSITYKFGLFLLNANGRFKTQEVALGLCKEMKDVQHCESSEKGKQKITTRYYLTPIRMAIIKKTTSKNASKNVEKRQPWYTVSGDVNWCNHYGKQYGSFSENSKWNYHVIQQFNSWI